jgi:nitrogen regulatory protein PII-like uncharacterized protein
MIQGKTKTEGNYRAVNLDSSSSLKDFSMDRKKYFRKYIQLETVNEKYDQAVVMGQVVEILLLEPEEFDNKFYLSSCANPPTAMMLDFVEALYKFSVEATNEQGVVTRSFDEISKDAFTESGYSGKGPGSYENVIKKFIGSDAEIYYEEIRNVRSKNLIVIGTQDVANAEKIVEELKNNFATKDIINCVNSSRYTVLNQFQVQGYEVDGHLFKSMLDRIIVDHTEKEIQPYDLKCTWSVDNFYEDYYLYRRAYIQGLLYWYACKSLTENPTSEYFGYEVRPLKFIVCDSINYMNPLVFSMSGDAMEDAYSGFEHKGRTYPGVQELITDLKWALDRNVWNISRKNYESGGVINI